MDKLNLRILEVLQNDFPLSARPYEILSRELKIPCDPLWDRVQKLLAGGVIRRIGASLDSHKLGFCSTLAAVSVKPELVKQAAETIEQFSEVTHSYLRRDKFNIWFTIITTDKERIGYILEQICTALSLESSEVLNLPVKHLFKLDARFNVLTRP